jgi:glycyl-tRNA synthetase beta chain
VLPRLITRNLKALPWPKSMRGVRGTMQWVRPLHRICRAVRRQGAGRPFEVWRHGESVPFGDSTRGHRFLAPMRVLP